MDMGLHLLCWVGGAGKDQEELGQHIKRRESGRQAANKPKLRRTVWAAVGLPKDRILEKEAGGKRRAHNGQCRDQIRPIGRREIGPETAHLAHVLFAAQGVNHAAGAQEKTCLEKRVSKKMTDRGTESPDTDG